MSSEIFLSQYNMLATSGLPGSIYYHNKVPELIDIISYLEHFCFIIPMKRDHFTSNNWCTIIQCKHVAYERFFFTLYTCKYACMQMLTIKLNACEKRLPIVTVQWEIYAGANFRKNATRSSRRNFNSSYFRDKCMCKVVTNGLMKLSSLFFINARRACTRELLQSVCRFVCLLPLQRQRTTN